MINQLFGKPGNINELLNMGERLHLFTSVVRAFFGEEPQENAHPLEKGAYWLFGAGKDDERRVGKLRRQIASEKKADDEEISGKEKAEMFVSFCEWLFTPKNRNFLQKLEAGFLRNAFFVYIAKAGELSAEPKKIGTRTTTHTFSIEDKDVVNQRKKVTEKTVVDITDTQALNNQGRALILEIVGYIQDFQKKNPDIDDEEDDNHPYRLTQKLLYDGCGIPCRRVGDIGLQKAIMLFVETMLMFVGGLPIWVKNFLIDFKEYLVESDEWIAETAIPFLEKHSTTSEEWMNEKAIPYMEDLHDRLEKKQSSPVRVFFNKLINWV